MPQSPHWIAGTGQPLRGSLRIPGDKSISHRAVMFAALADGVSTIDGFLEGEDTRATAAIFARMGVRIETPSASRRIVHGVGVDGLQAPDGPLDCGNAGTGMRLLAGLLAAQPFDSVLVGDASLSKRPMRRVTTPLALMGARIDTRDDGTPPLHIHGGQALAGIDYALPVASAQVKSAILLAAMFADGATTVHQPAVTRDHTERLFRHFSVPCTVDGLAVSTQGPALPAAHDLTVPADISSAAFWMVAAASRPGSRLTLRQVGLNNTRNAVISALKRMGVRMDIVTTSPEDAGEPYGDITVYGSDSLHGTSLLPEEIPNLIDEIPILAVAGALGQGDFIVRNARELRVKETDRIATTAANLRLMGVDVEEFDDGMVVHGGAPLKGAELPSYGDHRIAMSFLVAGFSAQGETVVTDAECINTSYPGFERDLAQFL